MDIINQIIEELEQSNVTYQDAIAYIEEIQNCRVKEVLTYSVHKHFREEMSNAKQKNVK